ncbi:hypothetical protein ABGN05_07680 [Aquibium sp. LZ166]|uniref:Uncharacterized protein n=1 Tax=Aquibium pacificus TaxID=3153579 RepID=A0ABV3SHL5_9HYPH
MSEDRTSTHDPKSKGRSAVSNGTALFLEADGRSSWAKRFRDLVAGHISDLGGSDCLSEGQRALIRRGAALGTELERMEGRLAEGLPVDLDLYGRLAAHQRRILESIGLVRKAKDVSPPDLKTYLAAKRKAAVS